MRGGSTCITDADCPPGDWCNESIQTCTPRLANGTPLPVDPAHTNPTLNGTCTGAAAVLVCQSGVCDTVDNKCGYANGDGPCNSTNGPVVCRSGACSANGVCEPAGGCNVDADCAGGTWCNESTHTCTAKLANGIAIPSDAAHLNPTLNGTCTAAAAALVCQSGVCDAADNKCGYANNDGPCNSAIGPVVCRSGVCSANGLCEPAGGCNVDADCSTGFSCCGHTCISASFDINNCGACGTVCAGSQPACNNGICLDLSSDITNCGAVDNACSAMSICRDGVCVPFLEFFYSN